MVIGHQADISPEKALQDLILDPDLERLEALLAGFNLFEVLGITRREVLHSAFLAWLLDPRGSHGLGEYFLRRFLLVGAVEAQNQGIDAPTPFEVDGWKLMDVEVQTERTIPRNSGRIDIFLAGQTDGFVCLIENKIDSSEHSDQLSRYLQSIEDEEEYANCSRFPIYLTRDGRQPDSESDATGYRYIPLSYEKISELIARVLNMRESALGTSAASFIRQYVAALRRHVLDSTDNITELAYDIYAKHQTAISIVIRAREDYEKFAQLTVLNSIQAAVPSLAPDMKFNFENATRREFRSDSLYEIGELTADGVEHGCLLYFKFRYRRGAHMVLEIGPGPSETRERIHRRTQIHRAQNQDSPFRNVGTLTPQWTSIYHKSILRGQDIFPFNSDNVKLKIEQAIREFYANDYWRMVNAIREEFGLPSAHVG